MPESEANAERLGSNQDVSEDARNTHASSISGTTSNISSSSRSRGGAVAAAAGDGCYVSALIQNRRYYGLLVDQDALKAASGELLFPQFLPHTLVCSSLFMYLLFDLRDDVLAIHVGNFIKKIKSK